MSSSKQAEDLCLDEAHVQTQAAAALKKIEASGGICCTKEGIYRVIEAMKAALDKAYQEKE
jgi:hypothetical protein